MLPTISLPSVNTGPFSFGQSKSSMPYFPSWLNRISPDWQWDAQHLQHISRHLDDVTNGRINRLMLFLPPRHGKSEMTTVRYSAWQLQRNPKQRIIIGAYSQTLANKFSRKIRKIATNQGVPIDPARTAVDDWETIPGGGVRAAGVGAGVTGMGGDLIIIDDPVKNREEANSITYRDKVWSWYTDDLYTRLEPGGAIILIMTRWHEDDLAGRILASEDADEWTVVSLPAIAETGDALGREVGAALWPERYNVSDLSDIKRAIGLRAFTSLYQQRPTEQEGGMFKRSHFQYIDENDIPKDTTFVWYWDKAATAGAGDYTAGVKMGRTPDGRYIVADVVHEQLSTHQRDERVLEILRRENLMTYLEREGGSSGKDVAVYQARIFAGFAVFSETVTGSKETRAQPFSAQCEAGNVYLVRARWNNAYIDELCMFPNGAHDDMVDSSSGAFSKIAVSGSALLW